MKQATRHCYTLLHLLLKYWTNISLQRTMLAALVQQEASARATTSSGSMSVNPLTSWPPVIPPPVVQEPTVTFTYNWIPVRRYHHSLDPHGAGRGESESVSTSPSHVADAAPPCDLAPSVSPPPVVSGSGGGAPVALHNPPQQLVAPHGVCHAFFYEGHCDRVGCAYRHSRSIESQSSQSASLDQRRSAASTEYQPNRSDRRSPSPNGGRGYPTTTRFNNHNRDPEYFGADYTYRPRGFNPNRACYAFQAGHCEFGSGCRFSHDVAEHSRPSAYQ